MIEKEELRKIGCSGECNNIFDADFLIKTIITLPTWEQMRRVQKTCVYSNVFYEEEEVFFIK